MVDEKRLLEGVSVSEPAAAFRVADTSSKGGVGARVPGHVRHRNEGYLRKPDPRARPTGISSGSIIPGMTRVAWSLKKGEIKKEIPGITRKKFLYNLSRASYEKEWGTEYHKPGYGTKFLTFLFRIIPTSGPFRALKIRTPTPEVEKMFMASFNATVDAYRALIANVGADHLELPNDNFDVVAPASTREPTKPT